MAESIDEATAAPGSAAPRKPCSGLKSATSRTPAVLQPRHVADPSGIHAGLVGHQTHPSAAHQPAGCRSAARRCPVARRAGPAPGPRAGRAAPERPSAESQHDESSVHPTYLATDRCDAAGRLRAGAAAGHARPDADRRHRRARDRRRDPAGRARRARPDRAAGHALDPGHLRGLRRRRLRARRGVGRLAPRRRDHRVGRLSARRGGQAQPAAAALAAPAARGLGLRGRHQHPAQRRDAVPPNMGVGATGSDSAAYDIGRITALEGRAVGVQLAFAPVADVNNNPANPIINTRAFGEDPAEVGRLVAAEVRGLQDHGMLATAKHFPGHGDTGTDSHLALPVIGSTWARLDSVELVPFRAAIAAGVRRGDVGPHRAPRDRSRPAAAGHRGARHSHRHPARLARLPGLIVTDALNMAGVADAVRRGGRRPRLPGRRRPAAPARRPARGDRRDGPRGRRAARSPPSGSTRRCGGCSSSSARLGLFAPAHGARSTASPRSSATPRFQADAAAIAARSIVMVKDSAGVVHGLPRGAAAAHARDLRRGGEPHGRRRARRRSSGRRASR